MIIEMISKWSIGSLHYRLQPFSVPASSTIIVKGVFSHGDDLGYIFRRNSIFGKRLPDTDSGPVEPKADKVSETFTEMIANFARHGEVSIPERELANRIISKVDTFGGSDDITKANSYVSVTTKLTRMNDFRYCEMGLWTGLVERLESMSCEFLKSSIETVQRINEETVNIVENIGQGTVDVGDKLARGLKLVQSAAADVGNVMQGSVLRLREDRTTASETVKAEQGMNSVRSGTPNIDNSIPEGKKAGDAKKAKQKPKKLKGLS